MLQLFRKAGWDTQVSGPRAYSLSMDYGNAASFVYETSGVMSNNI